MRIIWSILKWILILVGFLLLLGVVYEQYSRYSAKKNFVDNGTYVEVNGHQMHYVKHGEGTPTVVFESGLDFSGHMSWYKVQAEVSKFATTISYDRAGILRSEKSDNPRTCENMADELHTLLEKIEAKKPYVLVAHSMGGLMARCYVKKYANTLRGIVFVDASHPEQIEKAPESIKEIMKSPFSSDWIMTLLFNTGILRTGINMLLDDFLKNEKDIASIKSEINAYLIKSSQSCIDENKMFEQMTKASKDVSFGDIPLTILSAKVKSEDEEEQMIIDFFSKLQEDSLKLSTDSKLISVDSGHVIQIEKPEVVVEAVREMVK